MTFQTLLLVRTTYWRSTTSTSHAPRLTRATRCSSGSSRAKDWLPLELACRAVVVSISCCSTPSVTAHTRSIRKGLSLAYLSPSEHHGIRLISVCSKAARDNSVAPDTSWEYSTRHEDVTSRILCRLLEERLEMHTRLAGSPHA